MAKDHEVAEPFPPIQEVAIQVVENEDNPNQVINNLPDPIEKTNGEHP